MRILLSIVLLLPAVALAEDERCKHSEPRSLQLDFSGVRTVVFDIGPNDIRLEAVSDPDGAVQGRACASHADHLEQLSLTQERLDDKLIVRAEREGKLSGSFFGRNYARMHLTGSLPDDVTVELTVGSGDARVTGAAAMSAIVGSGDAEIARIGGRLTATVGSGDIEIYDVGELRVGSIGSGDIEARNVRGAVSVGSIGSGDFDLEDAGDDVEIGSIGSGDADLKDIGGNVTVDTIGSGDVEVRNVRGDLIVRSKGSGSVEHSNVDGSIDVPSRH